MFRVNYEGRVGISESLHVWIFNLTRKRKSYFNWCDKQNLQPNTMTDFPHNNVFSYTSLSHVRESSLLKEPQTSNIKKNIDKIQSRGQIFLFWYLNSVTKIELLWLHHVVFWENRGTQAVSIFWTVSWTTSSFNGTTFSVSTGVVPGGYLYFIVLEEKIRQNKSKITDSQNILRDSLPTGNNKKHW